MTPAINRAKKEKIEHKVHKYKHDSATSNFGEEAAQALKLDPKQVFKTLLFCINDQQNNLAVAIVPVSDKLNLKAAAKAMKAKKAEMANPAIAQKVTGYLVGGISPIGQKKRLPTFLDESALAWKTIMVSAGKRGLEIELAPQDLLKLTEGRTLPLTAS
jgi:Cys-tRNA(Pro)/Cys-tRNA(Cys) deacylase